VGFDDDAEASRERTPVGPPGVLSADERAEVDPDLGSSPERLWTLRAVCDDAEQASGRSPVAGGKTLSGPNDEMAAALVGNLIRRLSSEHSGTSSALGGEVFGTAVADGRYGLNRAHEASPVCRCPWVHAGSLPHSDDSA
jgi:hypothetical protein